MFSDVMVGLFFGIGFGGWVYTKMQRQTGGNTSSSVIIAGGAGLVSFLLIILLLGIFLPKN